MYNWSVNEKKFKKEDPEGYKIWKLEQMINYGEPGKKISEKLVRKYWKRIKDRIDPYKKRLIEYLLWGKIYSLPNNLTFWNLPLKKRK
ncbi:MAG: hypothetical protein QME61_03385 [Patescibacteria group bacterium]|nr:hypothetical protein [Patescibacteria group bacterium]